MHPGYCYQRLFVCGNSSLFQTVKDIANIKTERYHCDLSRDEMAQNIKIQGG